MSKMDYYSLSFVGRRKNNQDSCIILKPLTNSIFLAVADGMGGVEGGEVASKSAIAAAQRIVKERFKNEVKPEQLKDIMSEIFYEAQIDIAAKAKENTQLSGMGTTLTCVLTLDDKFVYGNIGDSRIYWYNSSELKQISIDHTYIQEYIDKMGPDIPEKVIEIHGHYLTRALNGGEHEPDIFPKTLPYESLKSGEAFILCSDGMILDKSKENNENFKSYLIGKKRLKDVAENLVSYAYNNGSEDNITVVLCSFGKLKRERIELKKYDFPPFEDGMNGKSLFKKWFFKT